MIINPFLSCYVSNSYIQHNCNFKVTKHQVSADHSFSINGDVGSFVVALIAWE